MLSSIDIRSGRDTAEGNRLTFWLHSKIDSKDSKPTQIKDPVKVATASNDLEDLKYEMRQEVPYKLTLEEAMEYSNEMKAHSVRVATLEKHHGQVYLLILGQCTQLLQDKMKQEKAWAQVSVSYKPLDLYKLIESVVGSVEAD